MRCSVISEIWTGQGVSSCSYKQSKFRLMLIGTPSINLYKSMSTNHTLYIETVVSIICHSNIGINN